MKLNISIAMVACLASTALFMTGFSYAHSNSLNEVAVKACHEKVKSQSCSYDGGHNDLYIGSCQYMADDLLCVRNQPIKKIDSTKKTDHQHIEKISVEEKSTQL
ncbi:MAG: hypothetical protein ACTJH9_11080 [Pseudoalteromonas sp.]|uniref:hypothetical protein n=1 Tax=unclassified Pseudoalteromonas TaxID=194690 RepID=UPI003F956CCE